MKIFVCINNNYCKEAFYQFSGVQSVDDLDLDSDQIARKRGIVIRRVHANDSSPNIPMPEAPTEGLFEH